MLTLPPMSDTSTPPLPTFLIIGAQKSATRWLRRHLGEHPEIFVSDKELRFFNGGRFDEGLDSYRANFEGWTGEPIVGEATPSYMMWREDPAKMSARIHDSLPDVKLFALLRNPVDRTYSAFVHHMRAERIPPEADLMEQVRSVPPEEDRLGLIAGGWYAASLAPYFERFGDRLRVFLHDEVVKEPEEVYGRALNHVGASPGFAPQGLGRMRYSGKVPEGSVYAKDGGGRKDLGPEERAEIFGYFRDDMVKLEELLGRDLDLWRSGA